MLCVFESHTVYMKSEQVMWSQTSIYLFLSIKDWIKYIKNSGSLYHLLILVLTFFNFVN